MMLNRWDLLDHNINNRLWSFLDFSNCCFIFYCFLFHKYALSLDLFKSILHEIQVGNRISYYDFGILQDFIDADNL